MTETAYERILRALRDRGGKVIEKGGQRAEASCPAHDDDDPSMTVTGITGQTLIHCHGGCDYRDVLASIEMTAADLYDEKSATYRYDDGRTVKRFYKSNGKKGFAQTNAGQTSTLYRLAKLASIPAGSGTIFLVEGEKDVHAIEAAGGVATTAPQGAGSFHKVDVSPFAGHYVGVIVDRDESGNKWAAQVNLKLAKVAAGVRYYHAKEGKDAADHVAAGHSLGDFILYAPDFSDPSGEVDAGGRRDDTGDPQRPHSAISWQADMPAAKRILPAPSSPMDVARELAPQHPKPLTWWRGDFYQHAGTRWENVDDSVITKWLYKQTEAAECWSQPIKEGKEPQLRPWAPNPGKVRDLQHALGVGLLQYVGDAEKVMALTNGVLCEGRKLVEHTPERFNLHSLSFAYDPDAECPNWHAFLDSALPGDQQTQEFLAEWFGYVLSGRTDMEKAAALVGPPRCGKGTLNRILQAMVGAEGWAAPTLARLGGNFGLESLIGKSLAVMGDVRWTSKHVLEAVPLLLGITGNDGFDVDRKNRVAWTGRLGTRIMLMSNDAPTFTDASGALAGRMVYAVFNTSFFGREDLNLQSRLLTELPGILNWALDGLDRLDRNGHFTQAESALEMSSEVKRDASPIVGWVEDWCDLDSTAECSLDALLGSYMEWLEAQHKDVKFTNSSRFSRELRSAYASKGVTISRKPGTDGKKYQQVTGIRPRAGASFPDRQT